MLRIKDILNRRYSKDDFVFFWGHTDRKDGKVGKNCLSQWFIAPMTIDGKYYHCMEQYLMAEKARTFGDAETEQKILAEYNQMAIKKLGRQVSNYDDSVWSKVRQNVSMSGNLAKFSQNPVLRQFLLSTGDKILIEASPKDTIWGIGLEESAPEATDPSKWRGENLLGFALMVVRDRLRQIDEAINHIISLKEDDDPWPPKDFIEFCADNKFSMMIEWKHESRRGLFEGIKDVILKSAAVNSDKIMIDMRYGRGFGMAIFMFFEQLHVVLDDVAKENHFDFIFSLTPDASLDEKDGTAYMTLFA